MGCFTYQGTKKVKVARLQILGRKFDLNMNASANIDNFFTKVMNIVNWLRTHGDDSSDWKVVEKVLRSLPCMFESIVVATKETKDSSILFVNELMGFLLSHESSINWNKNSSSKNSFRAQTWKRKRWTSEYRSRTKEKLAWSKFQ